jgi:hypothetical protein
MILSNIAAGCISGGVTKIVDARPTNCASYCSYTQGFYSNANGLQKLQSGLLSTPIIIGRTSGNSITIPANTSTVKSAIKLLMQAEAKPLNSMFLLQ